MPASTALVDHERLASHLREHLGGRFAEFGMRRLGEGQSCLTFLLEGDGWQVVLRRPPRGELPPTAFDVAREFRVMSALADCDCDVPVPRPLLLCVDPDVLGAPFYVMEAVDGDVLRLSLPDGLGVAARARLSSNLVSTLARLHAVDWEAVGLEGFGTPAAYAERQVTRVEKLWERARFRDIPEVDEARDWLAANMPGDSPAAIVHGDYKLDNVIVSLADASVEAVVDWELSTIGDPLADLGWLLYFWLDRIEEAAWPGMPAVMTSDGFLRREQLVDVYAEQRPVDRDRVRWYAALAGCKVAVMMEGSYRRFREGVADHATFAALEDGVPYLARRSLQIARGELVL
jgi:aminoglycoside phosphotransferase (APT) family kinase protein